MIQNYFYKYLTLDRWKSSCIISKQKKRFIRLNELVAYTHPFADIVIDSTSHLWFTKPDNSVCRIHNRCENVSIDEITYYGYGRAEISLLTTKNDIVKIQIKSTDSQSLIHNIYRQWIDTNLTFFISCLTEPDNTLFENKINQYQWVSPNAMKNYVIGTPLNDALVLQYPECRKYKKELDRISLTNFEKGNRFEDSVIAELKSLIRDLDDGVNKIVQICNNYKESALFGKFMMTVRYMQLKYPFIYQGLLFNCVDKTYGMPDLLIRGYFINLLFNTDIVESKHYDHYFVVDIKSTKFKTSKHTGSILSTTRLIDFYKVQLFTYNYALGLIQNMIAPMAFILYPSSGLESQLTQLKINSKSIAWCSIYFNNVGDAPDHLTEMSEINRKSRDGIHAKYTDSVKWVSDVRKNGIHWDLENPNMVELMPNIKTEYDTHAIKQIKYDLIKKQSVGGFENITLLWNCSERHQIQGWNNGVFNWKKDTRDVAELLGFRKTTKTHRILNIIIQMNQSEELYKTQNMLGGSIGKKRKRNDDHLTANVYIGELNRSKLRKIAPEIYVDLEFLTGSDIIYMIGVGWEEDGEYHCTTYIAQELSKDAEQTILDKFYTDFIHDNNPRIVSWGHVEHSILKRKMPAIDHLVTAESYLDLCQVFRQAPIVVRGSLQFGLKSIANALYRHKHIQTAWPSINYKSLHNQDMTSDILEYLLHEYYNDGDENALDNIVSYNEIDTKILWEILGWLREISRII
jgi:hypothetical protein